MHTPNATHDPALQSGIESSNSGTTNFPIQNLPYGRFHICPVEPWQIGVAIGAHGRASPIIANGQAFKLPHVQTKASDADTPHFGPNKRLDYELEPGWFIGPGNALGDPIPMERTEEHLFSVTLLNDWPAHDIQAWKYQPPAPFLTKNFAFTVSPWPVAGSPYPAPARAGSDWEKRWER